MPKNIAFALSLALLFLTCAHSGEPGLPTAGGGEADPNVKALEYPADLRAFRGKALKADGVFAPDIAFTVTHCSKCRKQYVFGIFPRLSRKPFDTLEDVHKTVEESARKTPPKKMFAPRENRWVPRACPYCGEPERNASPSRAYFCHSLPETGDDLQIDYTLLDGGAASERVYWRVNKEGQATKVTLADESEASFKKEFGCHFSLRAVWRNIFDKHWNDEKPVFENVAPGMYFVFRSEKVGDTEFREFADKTLKVERDKGTFTRLETPLKLPEQASLDGTYVSWAGAHAKDLSHGKAECFVALSLPELRSSAVTALASRKATLNLTPGKPSQPGAGFLERGPLKIPSNLAPLVQNAVIAGLSLQQACALYLADGTYTLDAAERIGKTLQALLPDCDSEFIDGRYMILRDRKKQERKLDLLTLANKLEPNDAEIFPLFMEHIIRWDKEQKCLGPEPKISEVSPLGLPAFVEKRIKPAEFFTQKNAPQALFETGKDSDDKRFDFCYTSECPYTVVYIDPANPRFKEIKDVNAARLLYALQGGILATHIENQDALTFPGGLPGMLECRAAIVCGTDVSSLAGDEGRATQLADFCRIQDDTKRVHFYAFNTHCAAVAPRKLSAEELALVKSRKTDLLKDSQIDPGPELNLHFDLPRAAPKGKILARKKQPGAN